MRRELSIVGLSLLAYATALVFGSVAICHASEASDIMGEWTTKGHRARVRIERCTPASEQLCGVITWLWEPVDTNGAPVLDAKNPDPRLRRQPVIGLSLLRAFRYETGSELSGGQIYNPENGRTYEASLKLRTPDLLEVKGCVRFVCDTQVWRRTQSLCTQDGDDASLTPSTAKGRSAAAPLTSANVYLGIAGRTVGLTGARCACRASGVPRGRASSPIS